MFSVFRTNSVNSTNLLQYTLDGHKFGMAPCDVRFVGPEEYEGAVEETVYDFEKLKKEEKKIKKRMDRIYLILVQADYKLSLLESAMNRIKLLQSTLFPPRG